VTKTAFWLTAVFMLLCLSACSAPQDKSAQSKVHPKLALDPESYAKHLAVCLAGEGGCNYDVLTREDRARVLALTGYGKETSRKAESQESPDAGQNP
jgi:hypothetical protein